MILQIKRFALQMIAGANIATAIIMLLVGMSDRLDPREHPMLANAGLLFPFFIALNLGFLVFFLFAKRKYAIIPVAGFLIAYTPIRTYCPLNVTRDAPEGAVKVLSYNVFSFNHKGAPENQPNPILDYIMESGADIACLQEAMLNDSIIKASEKTFPYRDSVKNVKSGDCLVLMSRFPILSKERIKYESKGNLSVAFKVKIGRDTVTVINNHFETSGLSPADRKGFKEMMKGNAEGDTMKIESRRLTVKLGEAAKTRAPQVDAVAEYVRRCKGSIILCGDFNDSPISYAHRTLAKELTDCYVAAGNGPGISYHHNAIFVRIDNIMCSEDWRPYNCKVDRSIGFSDHYPIYCSLERLAKDKK